MRGAFIFLVVLIAACVVSALIHENAGSHVYGVVGLFVGVTMAGIVVYAAFKERAPLSVSVVAAVVIGLGSCFLWPATPVLIIYVWRDSSPSLRRSKPVGGDL
jgi:predicted membrane channel-forming protein YqfA (hemolysin III family)